MSASLNSLPLEVRQKIYSLMLVESDEITIKVYNTHNPGIHLGVARHPHHRHYKHRGKIYMGKRKGWVPIVSSNAVLLRASKQTHADAAPLFYGMNKFSFRTTSALDRFLNQIGGMKAQIRHVSLPQESFIRHQFNSPQVAMHRSLKALVAARDLRTLKMSHEFFCIDRRGRNSGFDFRVFELVECCKPLLKSLKMSYEAKNLAHNFLDVIIITPTEPYARPSSDCRCSAGAQDRIVILFKEKLTTLLD